MFCKQRQTCICLSMPPIMATSLGLHREFETVETGIPVLLISDARVWMGILLSHYPSCVPTMATYRIYMQLCIQAHARACACKWQQIPECMYRRVNG